MKLCNILFHQKRENSKGYSSRNFEISENPIFPQK
ncbi:hypothetical protein T11_15800 [Trichinella zimbabwensis]|uniref:Uncharacterized protein n=1 Tax=Trichinella zimbabwensis TaxID=268475 RepID=A0A0V1F324_9BILA|nr:hypothetical protein T11_15800 [Trichinella zimbabwensis]